MGHLPHLWAICSCFTTLSVKNFFLICSLNLPSFSLQPLTLVLLQQALLKGLPPFFLQAHFNYWKAAMRSPWSLLQAEQPQLSQPFFIREVFQLIISVALLWTCSNRCMSFLCWELQRWMQDSTWGLTRAEQRDRITSLYLLAMLLLMQPRIQLTFWTASTHCWVMSSFSSTSPPKSFLSGLLSTPSSPSLYRYWSGQFKLKGSMLSDRWKMDLHLFCH